MIALRRFAATVAGLAAKLSGHAVTLAGQHHCGGKAGEAEKKNYNITKLHITLRSVRHFF